MRQTIENDVWVEQNFGGTEFGDKRLSKRLLTTAAGITKCPGASIPQQMGNWNDTKNCYGFLSNTKVTHKRIQTPHRERIKKIAAENGKTSLFLQDTSELDYTSLEETDDLGFIGNHNNKGLMFHSCLAIVPNASNPEILGLAHQQVWKRKHPSLNKSETRSERNKRKRESDVWLTNLKAIGSPPEGCKWVSIGDRANDIYEYLVKSKELGWESIVRASQDRLIEVDRKEVLLMPFVRSLHSIGTHNIAMRKKGETKVRNIEVKVAWKKILLQPPQRLSGKYEKIPTYVIRCWNEEEGLEWILYSSIPVNTLEEAIEKIEWYSNRWIIEEYHKCLKTGCRIESSQLEKSRRLEALLGVLGIIAILMLQLRNISREDGEKPANEVVDEDTLNIIKIRFNLPQEMTVSIFWRSVARLGGFIGRRLDGDPGWQTLWKGWLRLLDMIWGLQALRMHMDKKID